MGAAREREAFDATSAQDAPLVLVDAVGGAGRAGLGRCGRQGDRSKTASIGLSRARKSVGVGLGKYEGAEECQHLC